MFEVLGGATRDIVPTYASTLGYSHKSSEVARRSAELAAKYPAQKRFMGHGPSNRQRALEASVGLAEALRETVGPDYPLMFDAVMGWDLALAESWCRRVSRLEPTWRMYFGVTAVNRTWRDTWIDETAAVWIEEDGDVGELRRNFRSDLAVGRSVVAPGFDLAAYGAAHGSSVRSPRRSAADSRCMRSSLA